MDYLRILGEQKIGGAICVSGAKNAALPLLACALLYEEGLSLHHLPDVVDVKTLVRLLEYLGCEILWKGSHQLFVSARRLVHTKATYDIVRKMRASILVLGPLLGRFGKCEVSLPGGCAIGARPVDLHIKAMEKMGAEIHIDNGYIIAKAPNGLRGAHITFDKITVTGTENVLMAAALAKGTTQILNAAKEPEVVQLCELLQQSGVKIEGIGSDTLVIEGRDGIALQSQEIQVIPDRIEAGTYLCAGAILNQRLALENVNPRHLESITDKLEEIGFGIVRRESSVEILPAQKRRAFEVITTEYPGFPTDMQAQFMVLATQCEGTSVIEERLFENRFMHVSELQRLGAHITLKGKVAQITGPIELNGADVMATDLRASSALVLAALVAKGYTQIHRIYHLDRGYEAIEDKLRQIGIDIQRLKE
ncbi:UDP-N-acetylglucosamine 1-carboxyvinyltransferase [Helicobacter mustelae]|uniref:UDP-N-acetylglucosamine 1-carboxyvinyltransferase n=1 Tax=Helicobacter mustelae (strain ATCC 43772 / CCUG 25715 / CIP 103759 / LMG 18044 / NCTC 12198 / R85-136P) TaxID=679897 RepID=D3UGK7_HELM1|nr:UDP-N-acetylglucosamine 1-carboxyvinyltransferase [Helicobacter mustelae]CBG39628.1 UDP-N-acetylglucosamine 1-carboxyvinyltransferase [Helicobacter mustelae 12198]SQH71139.1 UDP-N-acetylglucosamine 1-carboxyvinyltransferase [Helicobacter mustelae]